MEGTADEHQVIRVKIPAVAKAEPQYTDDADVVNTSAGTDEPTAGGRYCPQDISQAFNASVTDIFRNEYRSPRPPCTTLQIPLQGVGEWCHPAYTPVIDDAVFRSLIADGEFVVAGVPFRTPAEGLNVVFTSLWDNYPDSLSLPLSGTASRAWLLMAGSTNHMQCHMRTALPTRCSW